MKNPFAFFRASKPAPPALTLKAEPSEERVPYYEDIINALSTEVLEPLSGIIGMQMLLNMTPLTEEQNTYLASIKSTSEHIEDAVNSIIEIANINTNSELSTAPFNLRQLIEDIATPLSNRFPSIELGYYLAHSIPSMLSGDNSCLKHALKRFLTTLMEEATKTTSSHKDIIMFEAFSDYSNAESMMVRFNITSSTTTEPTPIPSLVTDLITHMQGYILEYTNGQHRTTSICLPLERCVSIEAQRQENDTLNTHNTASFSPENISLLIVDNAELTCRLLSKICTQNKIPHSTCQNAPEALARLEKAHKDNKPFTHILLDEHLPHLSGNEAASYIRTQEGTPQPKLFLLSTKGNDTHTADKTTDFDHVLYKPLREEVLLESLRQCAASSHEEKEDVEEAS